MQNLEGYRAIKVGVHHINNWRYAEDTEESEEDLQQLLDIDE